MVVLQRRRRQQQLANIAFFFMFEKMNKTMTAFVTFFDGFVASYHHLLSFFSSLVLLV
jgi:hypothetical protein